MKVRFVISAVVLMACSVATLSAAKPAMAQGNSDPSEARQNTPLAKANPQISKELLNSFPSSILNRSSLYIDPSIKPGSYFVFTNGKIVPGQSSDQVRAAKVSGTECFKSVVLPIGARSWRTLTNHSCAIIGVSSKATHTFTVINDENTSGTASWQPQGYHTQCSYEPVKPPYKPKKKCTPHKPYWHAGTTGPGYITVPWGEVAAYPTARFLNPDFTRGWAGMWY